MGIHHCFADFVSVRKLAGLALLVAAVNARADFSTEFFTSESAPAGHYEYTQGGNTPTQLGLWTAAPTFNGPALTSTMWVDTGGTSNLPGQLELGAEAESHDEGQVISQLVFSFTADQDTTFSFSNLSIYDTSSGGSDSASWSGWITKTGILDEWLDSTGLNARTYSLLTGQTLAFYLQATAESYDSESSAWQQVRLVISDVEMNYTAIPEPGTVAAILGMAALGLVVWRRRAQA